jgi:hypothetical protein
MMKNAVSGAVLFLTLCCPLRLCAQTPAAQQIVEAAVQVELEADRTDHSAWMYLDHDITPEHDELFYVVESPPGVVKRKLEDRGRPLSPEESRAEDARLEAYLHDQARQQRQKHDERHDDDQATAMLKLLPKAFIWTVKSEDGDRITLDFQPNPDFSPDSIAAKVLAAMAGEIVVSRTQKRIEIIRGSLVNDVTLLGGLIMRLRKGGSFFVERREIGPAHWQITETHVHIGGHALFFKSIGEQEDEVKTDFKPSTAQTIPQAVALLNQAR